jgi:hypothetical protein
VLLAVVTKSVISLRVVYRELATTVIVLYHGKSYAQRRDVDIVLQNNDVLEIPGELRVLHTPGHTPGGIALYNVWGQTLFTGDSIWKQRRLKVSQGFFNTDDDEGRPISSDHLVLCHFYDHFDLNRRIHRQARGAKSAAGMPSLLAEYLEQQLRAAVYHLGLVEKIILTVDKTPYLYNTLYPVQTSNHGANLGKTVERGDPRTLVSLLQAYFASHPAKMQEAAVLIRALTGAEHEIAGLHGRNICACSGRKLRYAEPQLFQGGFIIGHQ